MKPATYQFGGMPDDPAGVLDRTTVGLAIHRAGRVTWTNRAFVSIAERLGQTIDGLAAQARSGGDLAKIAGNAYVALVAPGADDELIQVVPAQPRPATDDAHEIDDATGVLTRASLRREIEAWFERRDERPFALAFVDLDDFKAVNDQLGHLAGDDCLRAVGERLRVSVRSDDLVGRYGGDEFVLLLAGVTDPEAFGPVARRLQANVADPVATRSGIVRIRASVGVAFTTDQQGSADDLFAAADRDMYRNKAVSAADVADSARFG